MKRWWMGLMVAVVAVTGVGCSGSNTSSSVPSSDAPAASSSVSAGDAANSSATSSSATTESVDGWTDQSLAAAMTAALGASAGASVATGDALEQSRTLLKDSVQTVQGSKVEPAGCADVQERTVELLANTDVPMSMAMGESGMYVARAFDSVDVAQQAITVLREQPETCANFTTDLGGSVAEASVSAVDVTVQGADEFAAAVSNTSGVSVTTVLARVDNVLIQGQRFDDDHQAAADQVSRIAREVNG